MELNKEILKGHIDTLILAILEKGDSYGFEIAKMVLEKTTFELKDGTLYISLKRMESKGLIESYWQSSLGPGNRRKYYKITELGKSNLDIKVQEWNFVKNIMDEFLDRR
ncbi:MAG: PadR family transcriptional regulator [Romboutsia sp.]|uniref:PadR family transcriptional regulator n=1 Tax=Romboutsia sp. TaxID=1965302 RepID=UPI003F2FB64A